MNLTTYFTKYPIHIASLAIILVFGIRFTIVANYDPSYFILVSHKNAVQEYLIHDLTTFEKGYDGQFFYRYAINPFNRDVRYGPSYGQYGIKINNPVYRRSRFVYPLSAWILAAGQKKLIPYTLILVNIIAFIFLIVAFEKLVKRFNAPVWYTYLPLLVGGLYFSLARDLSDLLACTFMTWCYLVFLRKQYGWFLVLSTLLFLCKEFYILLLLPAYAILFFSSIKKDDGWKLRPFVFALFIPGMILITWGRIIANLYPDKPAKSLYKLNQHFDLPLKGIYEGLSIDFSITKLIFTGWAVLLIAICLKEIFTKRLYVHAWMNYAVWINVFLIFCYSAVIYSDPWSFMRVLAPVHLLCFLFLLENKIKIPKWAVAYSVVLALLSIRTIILAV